MKKFAVGSVVVAALVLAGSAQAADLGARAPVYKAPAPVAAVYNWSGWYVGVNAGGEWGRFSANSSTIFSPTGYFATTSPGAIAVAGAQSSKPTGATAGGQIGYNWQSGPALLGLEADFGYFGLKGSSSGTGIYPCCAPTGFTVNSSVKTDWLLTVRPRLGYAVDNWLLYVTGGLAVTELKGNFRFTDTFATASESGSLSNTKTGWAAGGGAEWALSGPWSMKLEYLHVDFGKTSGTSTNLTAFTPPIAFPTNVFTHSVSLKSDIVRVGLNYRFGGPVAARY
jgi:outer membrane immunogenic protein